MDNHSLSPPREAYSLASSHNRNNGDEAHNEHDEEEFESVAASSIAYSEFHQPHHQDSTSSSQHHPSHHALERTTDGIAEMHLALLFLLSHPEEFELPEGHLSDWNNHHTDAESLTTISTHIPSVAPPLPYSVFADDAEVVLPQAHTASQLFGSELETGMELEAASGIPDICRLFRRWLALFPDADHLHLIDPPGITVMRIAGNRYRVTAAHECFWTWPNAFDAYYDGIQMGDLVRMTIVDVFETDRTGKLLSYCPTFDNRAVEPFDRNLYRLRHHTANLKHALENSVLLKAMRSQAHRLVQQWKQKVDTVVYGSTDEADDGSRQSGIMGMPSYCMGPDDEHLELHEA